MRMSAVLSLGCLAGGLILLLPAAPVRADTAEAGSSRLVYEVLPLKGAARLVVNEIYVDTTQEAPDSAWVDVANFRPQRAQGFLVIVLDDQRLTFPWLQARQPPSRALVHIKVEGGKVEIKGDVIKIEGGKVEITRQRP